MKRRIKCGRSKINLDHLDLALRINNSFGPYFESSWLAQQKGKWRRTLFQGALLQSRQKVPVGGGVRLCSMRCRLSNQTNFQSGTVHPMADVFLTTKQNNILKLMLNILWAVMRVKGGKSLRYRIIMRDVIYAE